jgi:anhydro-N-acetylmuramic acid kinase
MSVTTRLIAGAMSGTSADGVDVALVRIDGRGLGMNAQLVRHHYRAYDPALRRAIFAVREAGQTSLAELARLGRQITLVYAACVNEALVGAGLSASDVAAVAAHGQTLYHAPPDTIQWLDPALLAAETGCAVVSDFRRADCAAGGQGAPLVPFADYVLFGHPTRRRVLVNIGGIANVTCLFPGASVDRVLAFDTGPGNCISDFLMRKHDPTEVGYDFDGRLAGQGRVNRALFDAMKDHPFFERLGPKSTDGPQMIAIFEGALARSGSVALTDQLASVCSFAVYQIARAVSWLCADLDRELIVSGGGTKNATMMRMLSEWLGNTPIFTPDSLGVPSDAKEAIAFALLGAATLDGEPSNVPSCTGARRRVVLGSITPRP